MIYTRCNSCGRKIEFNPVNRLCNKCYEDKYRRSIDKKNRREDIDDKLVDKFYKSSKWQRCREAVLMRDKGLCQLCLEIDGMYIPATEVHHIVPVLEGWGQRLWIDNLVSLCEGHHKDIHRCDIYNINELLKYIELNKNSG